MLTISTRSGDDPNAPGALRDGHVVLSVTDTGMGISPAVQAQIFEPFFTTKEHGNCTGLGLAAVHGIVMQLNGSVEVESLVGQGTTFRVALPAPAVAVQPPVSAPAVESPIGRETILLVEDERGVRAFIKTALQRFGYRVLEADSAESALALRWRSRSAFKSC